jgi:hypothetical protein
MTLNSKHDDLHYAIIGTMNKAFVKEPDGAGPGHCPRCGSLGDPVGQVTLSARLPPDALHNLAEAACFCPYSRCDVAYFDEFDRVVGTESLLRPAWPKAGDAPLCACFGLTLQDMEQDIEEGVPTRVRALLAQAKSPAARCATEAANGQSCVGEVQRSYLRLRDERQSGKPRET